MGWLEAIFVGAVIGFCGWRLRPDRATQRVWLYLVAGALLTCCAKLAGDFIGVFGPGDTLEWLASVAIAIAGVSLLGLLRLNR